MKRILFFLAIAVIASAETQAQNVPLKSCGPKNDKVCKLSADKKEISCYKTKYAENFAVCKGDYGYFICCQTPNRYNTTQSKLPMIDGPSPSWTQYQYPTEPAQAMPVDRSVPQNQSYTARATSLSSTQSGARGSIRTCYVGNNVAELSRAPYEGCESPQSDGPKVNKARNVNVVKPADLSTKQAKISD